MTMADSDGRGSWAMTMADGKLVGDGDGRGGNRAILELGDCDGRGNWARAMTEGTGRWRWQRKLGSSRVHELGGDGDGMENFWG
jgi:hypothetical protein